MSDIPEEGIADAVRDVTLALDALWTGQDLTERGIIDLLRQAVGSLGGDWTPPPEHLHRSCGRPGRQS
ncbi:MAG: hypothetical protein OXM88_02665 [bacterium]|nr:hypothetical protein [bacterium]